MIKATKILIVFVFVLTIMPSVRGESNVIPIKISAPSPNIENLHNEGKIHSDPPSIQITKYEQFISFTDWINEKPYHLDIDKKGEKENLRDYWERLLGIDVFYPYFKVNEIEEKSTFSLFKMRGRLELQKDDVEYTFRVEF